jgi:hypothetical protein
VKEVSRGIVKRRRRRTKDAITRSVYTDDLRENLNAKHIAARLVLLVMNGGKQNRFPLCENLQDQARKLRSFLSKVLCS